ncbi:hypothetical protein Ocin01_14808 [Orchesella cincta]|uniref:Uncharacterized protein n=1 Tax=Orchesella cincta TaxID=48709 RepID=A0A1D2MG83_ORCCI|nr:hypothetical protein Ocin01_14808 [Orchesella cincta]
MTLYQQILKSMEKGDKPESYCSWEATFHGPQQRVISYSLFRSKEKGERKSWKEKLWKRGLTNNLQSMRKYFPGWVIRVYSDLDDDEFICELRCGNLELFWCDIRKIKSYGDLSSQMDSRTWRFLPLGDPTVDVFLIRDIDSLLIARDAAAVQDWLENTTKAFHAFRDHPAHVEPALGGLWGGRNDLLSFEAKRELHNTIVNQSSLPGRHKKYFDQDVMLDQIIFPPNRDYFVYYDSYYCEKWRNVTLTRPFPTQRKGNEFLGEPVLWGDYGGYGLKECPESCRPEHGKSWSYC